MSEDPPTTVDPDPTETLPDREGDARMVGNYRLLQKIGEGGMGEVWEAEQLQPVQRRVALKLIKRGMDSAQVLARFESERQALALMDHPAIARVFDAGTTERGRPFFVMEHVQGLPITEYCDRHRMSLRERLDLFSRVCEGVQHAHQKAVIHRDLKPSNLLIAEQDGNPVPKIIDFGVAKATAQRLTERTLFTEMGQLIGTPEYMSPEQAEITVEDVDIRTDVYSLGMVLYELLVGVLPFDPKELRQAGLIELQQKIREDDPPRPSTRVTYDMEASILKARNRRTTVPELVKSLKGDLDWVVMKALEKDRRRRYETAHAFALDIGRFLADQAVAARPPSTTYRARKFVRRHRVGVSAAIFVLLALFLGILSATVGLVRARRAEETATREALTAQQVSDFLIGLFEVSDPTQTMGETLTVREILDEGANRIRHELVGEPEVQARLMNTMGTVYLNLALYENSEELLRDALQIRRQLLGNRHLDVADSLDDLADLQQILGRYEEARPTYEEALSIREELLGVDDPVVAETLTDFARLYTSTEKHQLARELLDRALVIREKAFGRDHLEVAETLNALATLSSNLGEHEEARELFERALEIRTSHLGPDHPAVAKTLSNLAIAVGDSGDLKGACQLNERALAIRERVYGPDHPEVAITLNNLSYDLSVMGDLDSAQQHLERSVAILEGTYGPEHPSLASALLNLAINHARRGRLEEARPLFERVLAIKEKSLGSDHSEVGVAAANLGVLNADMGDYEAAQQHLERSLTILEEALGRDHPRVANSLANLATLHRDLGDPQAALPLAERALEIRETSLGPDHLKVAESLSLLASTLAGTGKLEAAGSHYERALAIQEGQLGTDHPMVVETLQGYSDLLRQTGRGEEADSLESRIAAVQRVTRAE